MKLRVLGCSGGIGGPHLRTTSFLVDHDILIDAGSGVCQLSLDELAAIDHVFLTHAHLDHILALPLMVDAVGQRRGRPLVVHAIPEVLDVLNRHIFNWAIWPDFTQIPDVEKPFICFQPIGVGQVVQFGERSISPLPVAHTVPAVGYCLDSGKASLVFSGDTGPSDAFWKAVNRIENLRYLLIECAFSDQECSLAEASMHLFPSSLVQQLRYLDRSCELFITHLKPVEIERTMSEVAGELAQLLTGRLKNDQVFEF